MSTWKPIETANAKSLIDLWSDRYHLVPACRRHTHNDFFVSEHPMMDGLLVKDATHWREPDKGPGQEEGEVRWMMEFAFLSKLHPRTYETEGAARAALQELEALMVNARVVRVRIVRAE